VNEVVFNQAAASLGVKIETKQIKLFQIYEAQLKKWGKRVRLVSRGDGGKIRQKHLLDSLASVTHFSESGGLLLDLGSGAGFPGIPIKIVRPDLKVVLLEPTRMKVLFLRSILGELGMSGIEVVKNRAECLASKSYWCCRFNFVTCRAVGSLARVWALSMPLLQSSGTLVVYKGPNVFRELREFSGKDLNIKCLKYCLPVIGDKRTLILLNKKPSIP